MEALRLPHEDRSGHNHNLSLLPARLVARVAVGVTRVRFPEWYCSFLTA